MNIQRPTEKKMSEQEYRQLKGRLSSSDIRTFIQSRKKFYKSCILGEVVESEESVSTILGSIADCHLTCPELHDSKFVISTAGIPGGQMGELCEAMYKRAKKSIRKEDDGTYTQTESFEVIFQDAVNSIKYDRNLKEVKFKGKDLEKIIQLFTEPDKDGVVAEQYYREKLEHIGKTVVTVGMMAKGEEVAQDLKDSPYTGYIVNMKSEGSIDVYDQLMVLFTYMDMAMRAMLDRVIVDHNKKTIQPIDIKTTYDNETFDRTYLKGLYIQAATYDIALQKWAKENDLMGYEILPMKYPVADTQNENMPLLYQLTTEDIRKAYSGFKLKGGNKWWPGLNECIEDIKWHIETGQWKISREAYQKEGKLYLELEYA